jgi:hypothetical protein
MSSRRQQKEEARARRLELEAQLHAAFVRRRRVRRTAAVVASLAALGGGIALASGGHGGSLSPGSNGPEGVAIPNGSELAAPASPGGRTVDGIGCLQPSQPILFHIHAHLTVFVDGAPRQIPGGIGIVNPESVSTPGGPSVGGGSCFYWLHTHAADGIIHTESPLSRTYTLGDFFDIWGQPLGPDRVGPVRGPVLASYNGRQYLGDPRQIPLTRHAQIQLEIGGPPVAPARITFPAGL